MSSDYSLLLHVCRVSLSSYWVYFHLCTQMCVTLCLLAIGIYRGTWKDHEDSLEGRAQQSLCSLGSGEGLLRPDTHCSYSNTLDVISHAAKRSHGGGEASISNVSWLIPQGQEWEKLISPLKYRALVYCFSASQNTLDISKFSIMLFAWWLRKE